MQNLTASLEDYLELICNLKEDNECVKAVEIAKRLNISRASVSEALTKLADKNLIINEGHRGITITDLGMEKAKFVIEKHNLITSFFEETLGLNKKLAEETACKTEHILTNEAFNRLKSFQEYCLENKEFVANFKNKY